MSMPGAFEKAKGLALFSLPSKAKKVVKRAGSRRRHDEGDAQMGESRCVFSLFPLFAFTREGTEDDEAHLLSFETV